MPALTPPINQNDHKTGNLNASTTLLEFGDYECPYCGKAFPIVKKLLKNLGNKFLFVFRNFPLQEIHPNALHAAYAAETVAKQGKFWEMHDMLYENQQHLTDDDLFQYAQDLNLNMEKFQTDFNSPEVAQKVESDLQSGIESGVNGTPTFFINGERHNGSYSYEALSQAMESVMQ